MRKRLLLVFMAFTLGACTTHDTSPIVAELAFTIDSPTGPTGVRDLTVDDDGNVFVFDYDEYVIRRFSADGELLSSMGGPEVENGGFQHLMAIKAVGDRLWALDAGSLSEFTLSGDPISRHAFTDTVVCDFPRLAPSGHWAGEWIVEESAEKVLTHRGSDGEQLARVAGYPLNEFFPGVEPGGFFFINPRQIRSYLYDFTPDGQLVWAASDDLSVFRRDDSGDHPTFSADATPVGYPAQEMQDLRDRAARVSPPLFMNVPEQYQLIQHLLIDELGEVWVYLTSVERTGFLHLDEQGRELGFHSFHAGFDILDARVTAARGHMYFMVAGPDETKIYMARRP